MAAQQRLFLALQPDAQVREALRRSVPAAMRVGRRVPTDNLHLTLHFLGGCNGEQQQALCQVASRVQARGGQITLSRLAVWRGPRVQVLEPWSGRVPAWLQALHHALGRGLEGAGFRLESRRYQPHVTLARKCPPHPDARLAPLRLRFQDFVLMVSESGPGGVTYRVVERWPLLQPHRGARPSVDMK